MLSEALNFIKENKILIRKVVLINELKVPERSRFLETVVLEGLSWQRVENKGSFG